MLGLCPDVVPASDLGDHSYVAYLDVDDVDAVYRRALDAGAEVLKPPTDEPWGRRELALRFARRTSVHGCQRNRRVKSRPASINRLTRAAQTVILSLPMTRMLTAEPKLRDHLPSSDSARACRLGRADRVGNPGHRW